MRQIDWMDGACQIDDCDYLFVKQIGESEELTLDIHLMEAKPQSPILAVRDDSPVERLKLGARPVKSDSTCRSFHLIFDREYMVSYTVSNESYGKCHQPPEDFSGKLFRIFSQSHLLDFTKRTSHASDAYPGKLIHYELVCSSHVIDVIATAPPRIYISTPESRRNAGLALASLGGSQPDLKDIPRRRPE